MTLKERLQIAWKNKSQIAEGLYNAYIQCSPEIKAEYERRIVICRENKCQFYNPTGVNTGMLKAVVPGIESCGGCGCVLQGKTHLPSAYCWLKDIQQTPLWTELLTPAQDKELNAILYRKQFENK